MDDYTDNLTDYGGDWTNEDYGSWINSSGSGDWSGSYADLEPGAIEPGTGGTSVLTMKDGSIVELDSNGNPTRTLPKPDGSPGLSGFFDKFTTGIGSSFGKLLFNADKSINIPGMMLAGAGIAGLSKAFSGSGGTPRGVYAGKVPEYVATRTQLPIPTKTETGAPRRPGQGGIDYFSDMAYKPVTAAPAASATPPAATDTNPASTDRAGGGAIHGIGSLGGYSDGGRLLRGPGDGVSDSIPATIGRKQPARLADGEFVVPARIVSELGNGSTEAGARKLYSMMDRVQKARSKARNIAADTKTDRYLPA
jgi:hypothetical protein